MRDGRLDFWRGLCLIDMVVVHLLMMGLQIGHYPHAILGEYTRFAAGGFIFIAGVGVGRIFLPKVFDATTRLPTYRKLWVRAFYILCVHYTATLAFMMFAPLRGEPLPAVHHLVWDIVLLREGHDLLPFYVVMLAAAPLMLEIIRRGHTWFLAVASVALFAFGLRDPYVLAAPIQQTFLVPLWQVIFVAGLLFGASFKTYDALRTPAKIALASVSAGLAVLLTLLAYGWHFGLAKPEFISFVKVPLSTGETLRYLAFIAAIITVTDLLWRRWIDGSAISAFARRLGKRSLAIYVAHVFVIGLTVPLSYKDGLSPTAHLFIYIPMTLAGVWLVAWVMEWWSQLPPLPETAGRARRAFSMSLAGSGIPAVASVVILMLGIWATIKPMPAGDYRSAFDEVEDELVMLADDPPFQADGFLPGFMSPATPGIVPSHDIGLMSSDDEEGTGYARDARTGRTKSDRVGGGPFRGQL